MREVYAENRMRRCTYRNWAQENYRSVRRGVEEDPGLEGLHSTDGW
jgi:hypothetical protein